MKTIEKQVLVQCSDVEMKLNIGKCILAILIIIVGVFIYALASCVQCENNNMCNILVFASVVVIFLGIKMSVSNSRRLYYVPTRSYINYYSFHVDMAKFNNINSCIGNEELLKRGEGLLSKNGDGKNVECMISDDENFVAISSSDNMNFYSNVSSNLVMYFDADAQTMAGCIKKNYVENNDSVLCQ